MDTESENTSGSKPSNVPAARSRRKWVIVPASVALLLVALVLVAPLLLVRLDGPRNWLLDRSLEGVLAEGVRLRVGEIVDFRPGELRFDDLRFEEQTPDGWRVWGRIDQLRASWSPIELFGGRVEVHQILISRPELDLALLPDRVGAPRKAPSRTPQVLKAPALPDLSCQAFRVEEVRLLREGEPWVLGRLDLTDLEHESGNVHVRLERGSLRSIPDSMSFALEGGVVAGTLIRFLEVDSLRLGADGIDARLSATFIAAASGSTAVSLDGALELDRAELWDVPPLRRLDLPWDPNDRVRGTILFGGELAPREEPRADLIVGLQGRVFGTSVDTLSILADATRQRAELIDFRLRSGGQSLSGEGLWIPGAHHADGRVEFSGLDLADRPLSVFVPGLPRSRLSGTLVGAADSIGHGVRFDSTVELDAGVLRDISMERIRGHIRGGPEFVQLDTLWAGAPDAPQLRASGVLDRTSKSVRVAGDLDGLPLETWLEPWIEQNLSGQVSGPFAIRGTLDRPEVDADFSVRDGGVVDITVDTLHVGPVTGTLRPFALEAPFDARTIDFYGFKVDSLEAQGWFSDTLRTEARGYRDTTDIHMEARVLPSDPGRAWIDRLFVKPGSAPYVRLEEPTSFGFSTSRVWIDSVKVISPAGRARGWAWILPVEGEDGTEPFEFEILGTDLDLGAFADYFGLDADTINGEGDLEFRGRGLVDAPGFDIDFDARNTELWGWLWEEIELRARAGAIGSNFGDALHLFRPSDEDPFSLMVRDDPSLDARGLLLVDSLKAKAYGFVGPVPRLGPERFGPDPPGAPLEVQARSVRMRSPKSWFDWFEDMSGEDPLASFEAADVSGRIEVANVPLAPWIGPILLPQAKQGSQATFAVEQIDPMLAKIRIEKPFSQTFRSRGFAGFADLELDLGGTGGDPEFVLTAEATDVQVFQARADTVAVRAVFVDSLLYLSQVDWRFQDRGLSARGQVPVALSVDPSHVGWIGKPIWIEAEVPSVDLALVSLATALVEDPTGDLRGRARLKGIPPNVYMEGNLSVEDGAFRIPLREERLSEVQAELRLDSLGVHIESARGKWNETGTAEASGWFRDEARFELKGSVRNATVFETGNYHFVADGDFEAAPFAVGDTTRPRLTGDVLVNQGAITLDLANPGREKVLETPWLIDLEVRVPSNLRVIQPTSSVDLAGGELQVRYDMPYWSLGGSLDIVSGQYLVFNKSLEIVEGRVDFLDQGTGPFPVLDVRAQTDVADPDSDETIVIDIEVDGSPLPGEAITILVSSPTHPEYGQEDLIDLLTVGQLRSASFATGSSSDPARGFLTGQVLNSLERELIAEAPWLDVVDVRGGTDPNDPIVISFRAITEPHWNVRYSQELTSRPGREVSLSYRISNLFFLNAVADQEEDDLGSSNETYSLDLRLRYEF